MALATTTALAQLSGPVFRPPVSNCVSNCVLSWGGGFGSCLASDAALGESRGRGASAERVRMDQRRKALLSQRLLQGVDRRRSAVTIQK
eukprot:COSAG05_NODE_8671_length_681_cov_3.429553_1_plen_88_part_01